MPEEKRTRTDSDSSPSVTIRWGRAGAAIPWVLVFLAGGGVGVGGLTVSRDSGATPATLAAAEAKATAAEVKADIAGRDIVDLKVAVGRIETSVASQAKVVDELTKNVTTVLMQAGRIGGGGGRRP